MSSRPRQLRVLLVALLLAPFAGPRAAAETKPVKRLIRVLRRSNDYKQRLAAAIGLARLKSKGSVPALIGALQDPHHTVRGTAARVLAELGDPRAMPALEKLLEQDENEYVKVQAMQALASLVRASQKPEGAPTTAPPPTTTPPPPGDKAMEVTGTLGTLARYAVQDGVDREMPQARACFAHYFADQQYLGGKLLLGFRVNSTGRVKWVRLKRSDLGSLDTELCILKAMGGATFEPPQGGDAEFEIPLTFGGGDPLTELDESSATARQLTASCAKVLPQSGGPITSAGLLVAVYLDQRGRVVSAGMAADGAEIPPPFARRVVANLKRLTLKRPAGRSHAKLAVRLGCVAR